MTTLILSPDPATGSARLTITPTATVTRVRATDKNGTRDVRTLAGQLPHTTGELVLDDYEAAHGTITYTVTTASGSVTGSIVLALGSPWLGTPENPQHSGPVRSVLSYGAGGATRSTVHEPDGPQDPIVIVLATGSRRGSLTVECGDYAAALAVLKRCQRGQTMMLRETQHAGMDMYFLPMQFDIQTTRSAGRHSLFDVQIQYIEVGRPAGDLSGALGWTWAALEAAYPTWGDVFDNYAIWGDVRIDRRKP